MTRLPVLIQFLLAPFPALLAGLGYCAWRWTQSDWGPQVSRSDGYHQLGWTILPLVGVVAAMFAAAISRAVEGRRSDRWLAAALLTSAAILVLAYARSVALTP